MITKIFSAACALFLSACAGTFYSEVRPDGSKVTFYHKGNIGLVTNELMNATGGLGNGNGAVAGNNLNGNVKIGRQINNREAAVPSRIAVGGLVIEGVVDYSSSDRELAEWMRNLERINMIDNLGGKIIDGVVDISDSAFEEFGQ